VTGNAADAFGGAASRDQVSSIGASSKPSLQVEEDQSYTSRLLEAKRKAKKQNP
jgi:hypothetical protein